MSVLIQKIIQLGGNESGSKDTVSHNIFIGKLRRCGQDEWTVKWTENWLNGRTQRPVINGAESS